MTTEEIKRIIDDERAEQLTAQSCRHWEVATKRLEGLVQELDDGMDTCVEAEIYAALMRMQSSVMALMELNKMPTACLFSEYLAVNKSPFSIPLPNCWHRMPPCLQSSRRPSDSKCRPFSISSQYLPGI